MAFDRLNHRKDILQGGVGLNIVARTANIALAVGSQGIEKLSDLSAHVIGATEGQYILVVHASVEYDSIAVHSF